jgi:hypothetical protein
LPCGGIGQLPSYLARLFGAVGPVKKHHQQVTASGPPLDYVQAFLVNSGGR